MMMTTARENQAWNHKTAMLARPTLWQSEHDRLTLHNNNQRKKIKRRHSRLPLLLSL